MRSQTILVIANIEWPRSSHLEGRTARDPRSPVYGLSKLKPCALIQAEKPAPSGVVAWRALSSDQP